MLSHFAFLNLGIPELLLVVLAILLLFGARKLPELARSMGSSMRELRKGLSEGDNEKSQNQSESKRRPESSQ